MTDHGEHEVAGSRILILEDEEWDAELARRLLRNAGLQFTALVVDTSDVFTRQLSEFGPDVIISDYSLPGFTGADALRIARKWCPQVPFIVWSGVLGDEAAVELIKQGATDYILKDRPARLPSAVTRALDEARQRARLADIGAQLGRAQHLASVGRLTSAQQAVDATREMLAEARNEVTPAEPQP
jgi:DNA-binding NtrC family response regulator